MDRNLAQKVLDHFSSNLANSGHGDWCEAVKGPSGETWVKEADCNCGLTELKILLEKEVSNDTKNNP